MNAESEEVLRERRSCCRAATLHEWWHAGGGYDTMDDKLVVSPEFMGFAQPGGQVAQRTAGK